VDRWIPPTADKAGYSMLDTRCWIPPAADKPRYLIPPGNEIRHTERRQKVYKYMRIYLWSALRIMNLRLAETRIRAGPRQTNVG
jgi:hypothetical protein